MSAAPDLRTLEQLVDGELSPAAYRAALQALDQHPASWKTLAGLFLEAQALRADLSLPMKTGVVMQRKSPPSRQWSTSLAAAACLLVGVGLGSLLAPRSTSPVDVANVPPPSAPEERAPPREISVPVYSAGDVDPLTLWTSSAALPPGIVEEARERRQQLVREFQVVPVSLDDGRQVAFPVERVKLVTAPTY